MKQVAQNYKSGEIALLDVPVPSCKHGGVLVRTDFSLISMGTESMKVHESKLSLVGKARARPDQVQKVLQSVAQQGLTTTYKKVMNRLDSYTPLGYSLSGVVVEVGAGAEEFSVGQRVACGGDQYALHAEYNWVPKNLCVAVPDETPSLEAAFATVGAIALQGVRQSEAKLGETACVIGLGLIGQIVVQILHAAGVQVFGIDVSEERCRLAEAHGAIACGAPGTETFDAFLSRLGSTTAGADHVFLAAGGNSNQPVELAAELARDRARIVDIGKCKLDLPWKDYYGKELDVRFSRSYGPGRYDPSYEEGGVDYPIGYVRWTEKRNMACILDLIAQKKLNFEPLISEALPFENAVSVYEGIESGEVKGLGILFRYSEKAGELGSSARSVGEMTPRDGIRTKPLDQVHLGVIGCGNYASSMLLPHLKARQDTKLAAVATTTSLSAANARSKFGFDRMSTDHRELLKTDDIDAVIIATRHDSHARLVCEALRAGKAVFVEKPLAISPEQLSKILATIEETGNDRISVGFNRRFAGLLVDLKSAWGSPATPQLINYTVNAGVLESKSWYTQSESQGTRFAGEGGHFLDTVSWWLDEEPVEVFATRTSDDPDNLMASFRYPSGSIAQITYATKGHSKFPKETMEVFGEGKVARLHNFQSSELWQGRGCRRRKSGLGGVDKGQKGELVAFIEAVKSGGRMPIPLSSLVATTAGTLAAIQSAANRRVERVADWTGPEAGAGEGHGMEAAQ